MWRSDKANIAYLNIVLLQCIRVAAVRGIAQKQTGDYLDGRLIEIVVVMMMMMMMWGAFTVRGFGWAAACRIGMWRGNAKWSVENGKKIKISLKPQLKQSLHLKGGEQNSPQTHQLIGLCIATRFHLFIVRLVVILTPLRKRLTKTGEALCKRWQ